jgi:hypothetical protein
VEIYGREKVERIFKSQKIPVNSLGVEAKQKATENIKLINIRHEYKKTMLE